MRHANQAGCVLATVLSCMVLTGCSLAIPRHSSVPIGTPAQEDVRHCRGLRSDFDLYGGISVGAAFLSGGSGLSTLAFPDDTDEMGDTSPSGADVAMGVVSLSVGMVAAIATFILEQRAEQYTQDNCPQILGQQPDD